jgi:hypothetical protein
VKYVKQKVVLKKYVVVENGMMINLAYFMRIKGIKINKKKEVIIWLVINLKQRTGEN